jgi:hypothetical protein
MGYVSYPIASNPFTLLVQAYQYIQERSPAWQPHDGNLDTWILQATATQASDLRELATDVPDTIFRFFGSTILGIPPQDALPAIVQSTWTAIDADGHLIPAGTLVAIRDNSGTPRGFATLNDITILPGLENTNEGEVTLVATEPGLASEGIGGVDVEADLVDPFDFVESVVLTGLTTGAADAESVTDYTDRLSEFMRGLSTRPILPDDYARAAMGFPGVYRAVAIDGYDPANDSYFNTRMITVVGVDRFGLNLPTMVKEDLDTYMQSQREVNFVVHVIDPSRTTINAEFTAVALPNANAQLVESSAVAAVTTYLAPANWGIDPTVGDVRTWVESPWVRYNKILQVIENTPGIDYVDTLFINRAEDAPGVADVFLDLPAALTEPGLIEGTVV